jgi:hypothetical protein
VAGSVDEDELVVGAETLGDRPPTPSRLGEPVDEGEARSAACGDGVESSVRIRHDVGP